MLLPKSIQSVVKGVAAAGGRPFIVGGAVRDALLGHDLPSKDIDFEVYGISAEDLLSALSPFGRVETVGASFGVIKLWMGKTLEIDFALPRRESKTGKGHRGFMVAADPNMTPKEACARRDFTVNAMLMDPLTQELFDYFGGREDLTNRVLRHTSSHFVEDPLRPLRAMQFAGRYEMNIHPDTVDLCQKMIKEATALAKERIWAEWEKWALKSIRPSCGLAALLEIGWLTVFPELASLVGLEQNPRYHPEGDAWQHTLCAVDAACHIASKEKLALSDKLVLMLASLSHDLGKPDTTVLNDQGRFVSRGHAELGGERASTLLQRIGVPVAVLERVLPLVREHMFCVTTKTVTSRAVRRLANRLKPETIEMLVRLTKADHEGRSKQGEEPWLALQKSAKSLGTYVAPPNPLLKGRDLIAIGHQPGKIMGEMLREAFEAQLDGEFETEEGARAWALSRFSPEEK